MTTDLVGIIEAAYEPHSTADGWLSGIATALRPLLDGDRMGVGAFRYDLRGRSNPLIDSVVVIDSPLDPAMAVQMNAQAAPDVIARLYTGPVASSMSSRHAEYGPEVREMLYPRGMNDVVALRVDDVAGTGWIVCAPKRAKCSVSPSELAIYERLAAHFATARRLQHRGTPVEEEPAAILSPTGSVEHATGAARDRESRKALRAAAGRMEKARGPLRRLAPEHAVAEWRALVDGRWSLVDHFDHDGKRYIVARRNDLRARGAGALSKRESEVVSLVARGHSNKLVAYELGVSLSTVAGYLAAAMKKLGVKSRVRLVARWNALPRDGA